MKPQGQVQLDGPAILLGTDEPSLRVPDGFDLFAAHFARGNGDDLVISTGGGQPLTVVDYFAAGTPPALVAPAGAMLTGDVVALLAGPRAPAQYAQADAPQGATPIGQVETLSGTATATRATGERVELGQNDPVFQGDVLETGSASTLGVRLEDGTLASMSSQSRLVLNEFVFEAGGSENWMLVNLVEGAFAFLTGAIAPSGGMEITTPVAVMAIRGTMPIAFVAGEGGASQFFAGSDKDYELLHLTTRELLTVITSEAGFSLSSPDAALETIELDPETLNEINDLLDVLNDAAASLGLLGIQVASGFHTYTPFGDIDGNLAALIEFLLLLEGSLSEEAVLEVEDSQQFLLAQAEAELELIAAPDQAQTDEMAPVIIDVLDNDSHPEGEALTVVFADVPNGQGSVTIVDGQHLIYDPGSAFAYLALGETADVVITYAIADASGALTASTATVTVHGLNEAPVIDAIAETQLDEQTTTDPLETTIAVNFSDVDVNNSAHTAQVTGVTVSGAADGLALDNSALIALLTVAAVISNAGDAGGSVELDFSAASTVFDFLADGEILTLTYTVEIDDQDGGVASQSFDIVITGTNDAPVIVVELSDVAATVIEAGLNAGGNPVGDPDASGQIEAFDVDNGGEGYSFVPPTGNYGVFAISATGAWTYTLDDAAADHLALGASDTEEFTVTVTDGFGATAEVVVTITVTGSNDAPVVSDVAVAAHEDGPAVSSSFIGDDVDSDDDPASLTYSVATQPSGGTVVNNGDGTFSFDPGQDFQYLAAGETAIVTFTYTATDSHGQVSSPATVTVTVTGANDGPVISGISTGAVTEDTHPSTLTTGGTLTIADADSGQSNFAPQASVAGAYGTFTLAANGAWTYSAANTQAAIQELGAGQQLTDSFTAVSSDGTASQVVTVTIHGTNDVPVIGGVSTGVVTEDAHPSTLTAGGTLTIADADFGQSNFAPQGSVAGVYGTFTLAANGVWTYSAANAQAAIQQLGDDETLTDSFTAVSSDGTASQVVTVTIHGTNDAPVISVGVGDSDEFTTTAHPATATTVLMSVDEGDPVYSSGQIGTVTFVLSHDGGTSFEEVTVEFVMGSSHVATVNNLVAAINADPTNGLEASNTPQNAFLPYQFNLVVLPEGFHGPQVIGAEFTNPFLVPARSFDIEVVEIVEPGQDAQGVEAAGTLTVSDVDVSDTVSASVTGVEVAGDTAIANEVLLDMMSVNSVPVIIDGTSVGTINWAFDSGAEAFGFLEPGESLVLTYTIAATDSQGAVDAHEVTITIDGAGSFESQLESLALSGRLAPGEDSLDVDDGASTETDLSIDEVIVDYHQGDAVDLAQLGFEHATGQSAATAAGEVTREDSDFALAPQDVFTRLTDTSPTADGEFA